MASTLEVFDGIHDDTKILMFDVTDNVVLEGNVIVNKMIHLT